jgi:hypothetical protein
MTRVRIPIRAVLVLAVLVSGAAYATSRWAFFPNVQMIFQWTGEGDHPHANPAAIAWSVFYGPHASGNVDANEIGYRGRWVRSTIAKSGATVIFSGLPTNPTALSSCTLIIDDHVVDQDPDVPPGSPPGWRAKHEGATCKGVVP